MRIGKKLFTLALVGALTTAGQGSSLTPTRRSVMGNPTVSDTVTPCLSWTHLPLIGTPFTYDIHRGPLAISSKGHAAQLYKRLTQDEDALLADRSYSTQETMARLMRLEHKKHALVSDKNNVPLDELSYFQPLLTGLLQGFRDIVADLTSSKDVKRFLMSHPLVQEGKGEAFTLFWNDHNEEVLYGRRWIKVAEHVWLTRVIRQTFDQLALQIIERVAELPPSNIEQLEADIQEIYLTVHAKWNHDHHLLNRSGHAQKAMVAMAQFKQSKTLLITKEQRNALQQVADSQHLATILGVSLTESHALWTVFHVRAEGYAIPVTWNDAARQMKVRLGVTANMSGILKNVAVLVEASKVVPAEALPMPEAPPLARTPLSVLDAVEPVISPKAVAPANRWRQKSNLRPQVSDEIKTVIPQPKAVVEEAQERFTVVHEPARRFCALPSEQNARALTLNQNEWSVDDAAYVLDFWATEALEPRVQAWVLLALQKHWDGLTSHQLRQILNLTHRIIKTHNLRQPEAVALRRPFVVALTATEQGLLEAHETARWSSGIPGVRRALLKKAIRQIQESEERIWVPISRLQETLGLTKSMRRTFFAAESASLQDYSLMQEKIFTEEDITMVLYTLRAAPDQPVEIARLANELGSNTEHLKKWVRRTFKESPADYLAQRFHVYAVVPRADLLSLDPVSDPEPILVDVRQRLHENLHNGDFANLPKIIHQAIVSGLAIQLNRPLRWLLDVHLEKTVLNALSLPGKPFRMRNYYLDFRKALKFRGGRTVAFALMQSLDLLQEPIDVLHPAQTLESPEAVQEVLANGWISQVPWAFLPDSAIAGYLTELADLKGPLSKIPARVYEEVRLATTGGASLHGLYTFFEKQLPSHSTQTTAEFIAAWHRAFLARAA